MTTHLPGPGAHEGAPRPDDVPEPGVRLEGVPLEGVPLEGVPLEGGDPVCWLEQVCDACGGLTDGPPGPVCARCGTARPDGQAVAPP